MCPHYAGCSIKKIRFMPPLQFDEFDIFVFRRGWVGLCVEVELNELTTYFLLLT
jgi:hypothetical protein